MCICSSYPSMVKYMVCQCTFMETTLTVCAAECAEPIGAPLPASPSSSCLRYHHFLLQHHVQGIRSYYHFPQVNYLHVGHIPAHFGYRVLDVRAASFSIPCMTMTRISWAYRVEKQQSLWAVVPLDTWARPPYQPSGPECWRAPIFRIGRRASASPCPLYRI